MGWFLALVVLAALPFAPAVRGTFVWDDNTLLAGNTSLRAPDGWRQALTGQFFSAAGDTGGERPVNRQMYRPFVSVAYWLEFQAWGDNVVWYHLVNLALHAACVLLLFQWLRRRFPGQSPLVAFAGAAVFAVHPARVESVAWISGCTDLWMTLWVLIGLTIWDRTESVVGAIAAGGAFALGFFCKEVAIVVPAAIAIDVWAQGKRRASIGRLAALGGMALVALGARLAHIGIGGNGGMGRDPLATTVRVVATLGGYLRILAWPWPASTQTGYLASANAGGPQVFSAASIAVGLVALVALLVLVIGALRRPTLRPLMADTAWLVIPLLPVLNVIPVSMVTYVNERHAYLAGIGLAALVSVGAGVLLSISRAWLMVPGVAYLVALMAGSAAHAVHFQSNEALWVYEAARDPQNAAALLNLMTVRMNQGRHGEAREVAAQLLQAMPRPEDKAAALRYWLDNDLADARKGPPERLTSVRTAFDRIAAHAEPDGACGALYASIEESGRRWLRRSPAFRLSRALAAADVGDFASASRQLEALQHDAGPGSGALRPLVATLVASGDWDGAQSHVAEAMADPDAPRLQQLLLQSRAAFGAATEEAGRVQVVAALMDAAGESSLGRVIRAKAGP